MCEAAWAAHEAQLLVRVLAHRQYEHSLAIDAQGIVGVEAGHA